MALAATLALTACAAFPTLSERTALLAPTVQFYAPEPGGGPAPLVILASGCGGLNGLQGPKLVMKNYAAAATRAGAYVAVMDSFASRGISFKQSVQWVCSGLQLRGDERAGDIVATDAIAREHWKMNFTSVILAGWSHGGWTVMELLSAGPDAKNIGGFRIDKPSPALKPDAVALYYPYCGFFNSTARSDWAFDGPLLLLTAGSDKLGSEEECMKAIRRARDGSNDNLQGVHFGENTHAFDEEDQVPGSEYKYDPEATQRSLNLFERFVREQVDRLK